MNKKLEFNLTNAQKTEFGRLAIKKIADQQIMPDVEIHDIQPTSISFTSHENNPDNNVYLTFDFINNGLACRCTDRGYPSQYTDTIQPLYLNYMYKIFGEPFREAALNNWHSQYSEFQRRQAKETITLKKKLDEEYKKYLAHRHKEFDKLYAKLEQEEDTLFAKKEQIIQSGQKEKAPSAKQIRKLRGLSGLYNFGPAEGNSALRHAVMANIELLETDKDQDHDREM